MFSSVNVYIPDFSFHLTIGSPRVIATAIHSLPEGPHSLVTDPATP